MSTKTKVFKSGEWVDGEELDFKTLKEDWNIYEAEDGSIVKVKVVATKIIRIAEKDRITGAPGYMVISQNVVTAVAKGEKEK